MLFLAFADFIIVGEDLDLAEVHSLALTSHRFCFCSRDSLGFRFGNAVGIVAVIDLDFDSFPAVILNLEPRIRGGIH